jgi:hypothetical protein
MKKEKWSLWKSALAFSFIVPMVQLPRLWEVYYPVYESTGLSVEQVGAVVAELSGTMIGGAGLGFVIAIVRNRFFR